MKLFAPGGGRLAISRAAFSTADSVGLNCGQLIFKTVNQNKTWEQSKNCTVFHECVRPRLFFFLLPTHVIFICSIPVLVFVLKFAFFLLFLYCSPCFLLQIRFSTSFSHTFVPSHPICSFCIFNSMCLSDLRLFLLHCLQPGIPYCLFHVCPYSF